MKLLTVLSRRTLLSSFTKNLYYTVAFLFQYKSQQRNNKIIKTFQHTTLVYIINCRERESRHNYIPFHPIIYTALPSNNKEKLHKDVKRYTFFFSTQEAHIENVLFTVHYSNSCFFSFSLSLFTEVQGAQVARLAREMDTERGSCFTTCTLGARLVLLLYQPL